MTGSKDKKVTEMVLKVDLDCRQCRKKVKKVLCKFPQIQNQVFDEKNNTVTITVVCCSPEKVRDRLCCKAGKSIKSIEIKQPPKPKPAPPPAQPEKPKPAPPPAQPEKPKPAPPPAQPEKPKPAPPPAQPEKPKPAPPTAQPEKPKPAPPPAEPEKPKPAPPPCEPEKPKPQPKPAPPPVEPEAQWVPGYPPGPPPQMFPVRECCGPCSEGRPGGPCYGPSQGPAYPYGYYGRPCPAGPGYYGSRCDYFSEENPAACSIM